MGTIKDRNAKNLTEAEEIKKRLKRDGKNTWKNYTKKVLITQITMMVWSCKNSILKTEKHRETLKEYLNKQK